MHIHLVICAHTRVCPLVKYNVTGTHGHIYAPVVLYSLQTRLIPHQLQKESGVILTQARPCIYIHVSSVYTYV